MTRIHTSRPPDPHSPQARRRRGEQKHGEFVFFLGSVILTRNDGALLLDLSYVTGKHGKPYNNNHILYTTRSTWYNITHSEMDTAEKDYERYLKAHCFFFFLSIHISIYITYVHYVPLDPQQSPKRTPCNVKSVAVCVLLLGSRIRFYYNFFYPEQCRFIQACMVTYKCNKLKRHSKLENNRILKSERN